MAFDINIFRASGLPYGGARPSLFQIEFSAPPGVPIGGAGVIQFPLVCRAAELPESTIGSIEIPYFGRKIKVAGERSYTDWSVTVMNDEDFAVRTMFESWHNSINTAVSNLRLTSGGLETYKTDMQITQFAKSGEPIRVCKLVGSFPVSVGAITLNWDSANAIEEFTVSFAYDYWIPDTQETTVNISTSTKTTGKVYDYNPGANPGDITVVGAAAGLNTGVA